MCGIVALFRALGTTVPDGTLERMTEEVAHRGPDGSGIEYLTVGTHDWRVGLGHRRLAILDLSEAGRQPMTYRDGLWITFNGEIYNYLELRRELESLGHEFRTRTDTEVVLAAYHEWGMRCFDRFRGMWGLVLVDSRRCIAVLSRDRLGIKPLYLAERDGLVAVVSELKQLRHLPGRGLKANETAVTTYLATGYEDPASCFFDGVVPIPAGCSRIIDLGTMNLSTPEPYWWPERVQVSVRCHDEAARMFRTAFQESVRLHMRSDVPVGCALSGGLDSSAVAGCVKALGPEVLRGRLETFSVCFPGEAIDERPYMEQVIGHIGASPHYVTPTPEGFLADLDEFLWKHDEPVGSLSQYAGYAVARLTRAAGVPVTLNGQGGDEVLSGYWQCYFVYLRRLARELALRNLGSHFGGSLLPGGNSELVRQVPAMFRRYRARTAATTATPGPTQRARELSPAAWRVYEVRELTLPRLLKWDDRNFMAFSVEGRYPFLDHQLIELCLSFSPDVLYDRGWTKEPLRRGLEGLLPATILRRKTKLGFETPQDRWLAGPLARAVEAFVSGDSPAWRWTAPAHVRSLSLQDREQAQELFRAFLLDRWLRRFELT